MIITSWCFESCCWQQHQTYIVDFLKWVKTSKNGEKMSIIDIHLAPLQHNTYLYLQQINKTFFFTVFFDTKKCSVSPNITKFQVRCYIQQGYRTQT